MALRQKPNAAAPTGDEQRLLSTLREMLENQCSGTATQGRRDSALGVPFTDGGKSADTEQLLTVLDALQTHTLDADVSLSIQVREAVGTELGHISDEGVLAPSLKPRDADVVEIVSMLFDVILAETEVSPHAQALLDRLRVPVLKLALLEPDFFADHHHPARRLLNEVAQLDSDSGAEDQERIRSAAERIATDFRRDPELFAAEWHRIESDAAQEQAEQLKAARARDAQTRSRREVDALLKRAAASAALPEPIRTLLEGPWTEVLATTYLQTAERPALRERWAVIRGLVWSVKPPASAEDSRRMAAAFPRLVAILTRGMEAAGYDSDSIRDWLAPVESLHGAVLAEAGKTVAPKPTAEPGTESQGLDELIASMETQVANLSEFESRLEEPDFELETPPEIWEPESQSDEPGPEDPAFLDRARAIPTGTWVEFHRRNGKVHRARLAWRSEWVGECVFVDRRFRTTERSVKALARELERGEAIVVSDVPLIDRAVDSLLGRLRRGVG